MTKRYLSENEELMKEWDFEANKDLDPIKLTIGSNKKVWWKCPICQGEWQATISDRTRKDSTGCPYCAGKKALKGYNDLETKYPNVAKQWHPTKNGNLTPSDVVSGSGKKVWWICSKGHEFKQVIERRVKHPDSCPVCSGQKVAEGINDLQSRYPNVANEWHKEKNGNILPTAITWGSNKKFWWICSKCGYEWQAIVSDRTSGHNGCPACANKALFKGYNDLATRFPKIAKEWHPTKNGDLTSSDVVSGSGKKVWWICSKGHEYQQSVLQRTSIGQGCPICTNQKILIGYNDLATTHPEIAKEWHPTKNGDLTPSDVIAGSKRKIWWICSKEHEYEQSLDKRTQRGFSCPYCSGHKAWKGFNDFETVYPNIAKEWHPTKNGFLKPSDVTSGSGKIVWWKCPIGHEYQASIHDRGSGQTNCPICNSSRLTSFGEQSIYYYIKKIYPDTLNRYNELFSNSMEFDVYIPSLKTAIEYDGGHWHQTEDEHKREIKKYNFCKENNIILIRVKEENQQNWNDVADRIYYIPKTKRNDFSKLEQAIYSIINDIIKNTKIDIDISRDKLEIQNYLYKIEHSLADERPDVAAKWNYEKNGNLYPNMFSVGSREVVWWKCKDCGHEWRTSISHMTRKGRYGCPLCSRFLRGRKFTKEMANKIGSLAKTLPELAKEWHPTKNGNLTPNDITAGRFKPVWWLCPKCGHEWQSSPNNRKKGIGCPCCSGRVPKIGHNDLETKFPEIAQEWDNEQNFPLKANEVLPGSGRKVWWKCSQCGHTWKKEVRLRVKGSKCPKCSKNQLDFEF